MAAYIVFIRDRTRDAGSMEAYLKEAVPSLQGRDVKFLAVNGAHETLEGATAEEVVLLEFPSMAEAKEWYGSDAYVAARKHRHLGADHRVVLFEGMQAPG